MDANQQTPAIGKALRFFYQFMVAFAWMWENVIRPATKPFRAAFWYLWGKYRCLWDKVVYLPTGHFSKTRAGVLLTTTLAFLYILPSILLFIGQVGLFVTTGDTYTVYLTKSQEIYPDDDIHSVSGCETLPCSDQSSIYYRVGPSTFNHLWSLFRNWDIFYPDEVAAGVPSGLNECVITSYGFRWKFLMRRWDIYPEILAAKCDHVGGK